MPNERITIVKIPVWHRQTERSRYRTADRTSQTFGTITDRDRLLRHTQVIHEIDDEGKPLRRVTVETFDNRATAPVRLRGHKVPLLKRHITPQKP